MTSKQWGVDKSELHKSKTGEMKQCFCIGPENCKDENCKLVQEYKEECKSAEADIDYDLQEE